MKILKHTLLALLFCTTAAMAEPASESSIKQLLQVTQSQKLVDGMRGQFDSLMNNSITQALNGKTPNAKQKQAIDNMKNKMLTLMQGELAWAKMEPLYIRLYRESFTEEEVAGMLAFYKTPAGQAVILKTPALMQRTMLDLQKKIADIAPKMEKIQESFATEMSAASK